jgi:peptidoglycan/LPS O-acetylase OafA/YrhL
MSTTQVTGVACFGSTEIEPVLGQPQPDARIASLDGLRGWAALSVMFNHMAQVLPFIWAAFSNEPHSRLAHLITFTPAHLFWAGGEAVALFFVLSGYVLSAPYWQGVGRSYPTFLIRRVFRIYPAFLASCIFAHVAADLATYHPIPDASSWFNAYWHKPSGMADLISAALMGYGPQLNLNPALWSLVCEMRISVVFPIIIWLMRRTGLWLLPATTVISAVCKLAQQDSTLGPAADLWMTTGAQVWLFVLGAELSRRTPLIVEAMKSRTPIVSTFIIAFGLLMLIARWITPLPLPISYFLSGLGAATLIASAVALSLVAKSMSWTFSQFLGKCSYSLYLFHFPVLAGLAYTLTPHLPLWLAIALTPPVAVALARVDFAIIERPFIRYGRLLAGAIDCRLSRGIPVTVRST